MQKEEYKLAEGSSSRRRAPQPKPKSSTSEQSWMDWIVGTPAPAPAPPARSSEIRSGPRLVAAHTGEETAGLIQRSPPRVAEQKSMFACVADSVAAAATQMTALASDQDGNVHGVDSSSLLAMPDVSRPRD